MRPEQVPELFPTQGTVRGDPVTEMVADVQVERVVVRETGEPSLDEATSLASEIAVAVVSFNTRDLLRGCLAAAAGNGAAEVVVVDNCSTDGSVAMVRDDFPDVALEASDANGGYGAGANRAMARCSAEYVLLLNADAWIHPGTLRALVRYLDANPAVAVVGPQLLDPAGEVQTSYFPFPGTKRWLAENEPVVGVLGSIRPLRRRLLHFTRLTRPTKVPWVLGAALAIRRSAFESVGGFDEAYFMYFEEVDLCRRLQAQGWEVHYLPEAVVSHVGAASTSQVRASMIVEHFRSTLLYYRRHYRGARLAFWLTAMRAKMAARIVRDRAALVVRPSERPRLRENLAAWEAALLERWR